ncbi:Pyruvate/2-oxoglutarate dehydrogenase complex, dihydrolipoamide dehydrogenase (E3) component [Devosia lucknowensis]|uniref:Pyruvate/2-oxoglutarate dehydrogenase complex, dihydrolipoamide dehydrogenase (E3) component n=1 Tax=Devosia lucknowensis TaxID=1096929 RepID=A0A1Y6FKF9_9HYPH|nr:FAD-dependent oxidoreductase [Devosia lucknowensis]SMQ72933.1 Pyruvate/2-oxoglutarate dehydrogenase complex, dihydrolipoamide dehydrogenase (E3) component [Devosia lucknowensis]
MAEISRPELCVVGAGALGLALAQYARRLGAEVTLVDRGFEEPGDAPQRDLVVASIIESARRAHAIRTAGAVGVSAAAPKISIKAVLERAQQVAEDQAVLDGVDRLKGLGISVFAGAAHFVDAATLAVGDVLVKPQATVLALGETSLIPAVAGLEEAGFFTLDTLIDNTRKLTHLLVIGNDPEGLALAQAYRRLGSEVTVVPQGQALAGFDAEAAAIWSHFLREDGVSLLDGASVSAIQPRSQGIGATVALADGSELTLDLSHILVANGQAAELADLNLDAGNIRALKGQGGLYASGDLGQTSNRKVRVVGAAAGLNQWQHALAHGRAVVDAVVIGSNQNRSGAQPRIVPTSPALVQIGQHVSGDLPAGYSILRANLAENAQIRSQGESGGLIKVILNPKGRIAGASLVGSGAQDLAGVLSLAMDQGLPFEALAGMPLPRPSLLSSLVTLSENRSAPQVVASARKRSSAVMRMLRR